MNPLIRASSQPSKQKGKQEWRPFLSEFTRGWFLIVSHVSCIVEIVEIVEVASPVEDDNWFAGRCFNCVAFMQIIEMVEVAVLVDDNNCFAGSCFQSQTWRQVVCLATKWSSEAHPWKDRTGIL